MRRLIKSLAALPALAIAAPARALETSFHTYDGFGETVDAFRLVSMIFADPRYETLVLIVAVVGIGLGAVLASVRGSGMGLIAFGFQILVGVGLFVGLVASTGTVHVYDRVRNAYQPVGNVPNLLVLVAGATNMIERAVVETIDDNTLDPRAKLEFGAGGHAFDLFFNAVSPKGPMVDTFLDATLKDYVRQCYPVARVSPAYGVDDDKLYRTATDLPAAFAALAGPATFSTIYTPDRKGGSTMSCSESWHYLSNRLSQAGLFDPYIRQVCTRTGFDMTQGPQASRCRSQLAELGGMMMGTPLSYQGFMTDVLLGKTVGDVLFEDSPAAAARVMANRAVMSSGLATMSVANEWMPTIRATVFGVMLFMIPIALLFILTPINLRVASFALGLFVFVALWGVIDAGQASGAAAPLATSEGRAAALEAQASAAGTQARAASVSTFGDFGDRTTFGADRAFGEAGSFLAERPGAKGSTAFALGGIEGARQLGALAPALRGRDLADPAVARAVQASAATGAIHQFAERDALRKLGTGYFGEGETGEKAFAAFAQNLVQWRAFGDTRAYGMMMQGATRHFERGGYSAKDAALKASGVIGEAQSDPMFAKLIANSYDQQQMLANDLTAAQVQAGAMAGRRDFAGDDVAGIERGNVATEQAHRTGANQGQRDASVLLGLPLAETSRRIAFINALSGEARSSAITQLSRATGRNEAQVMKALETYGAATQLGTADGATAEAAHEGTSVYGRTREAAQYDFAERSGKLDAQREVGTSGTRAAARIGEQRRQADNFGFAEGAAAAGVSTREAARLDSFIRTLESTAGNQIDMAAGGAEGIADRARNARTTKIVENEKLSRMQGLLRANGISMSKRDLAMAQNGDLAMNVTPEVARQLRQAGLINDSQYGAIAQGGHARFSFADNDLLASSSTGFQRSARNDTSTRFEAGKQAGPDTIEHFLGGGEKGQQQMANWLHGGFEMDRQGNWRLKPQVADTLQRDVQAIMAQTGWQQSISRSATDQISIGTTFGADIGGAASSADPASGGRGGGRTGRGAGGRVGGQLGYKSSDVGLSSEVAQSSIDVINYDVRDAIAAAVRAASKSPNPEKSFTQELGRQVLGRDGLRNRYLGDADKGRGTTDITGPLTSIEQSSILSSGRFSTDLDSSAQDGSSDFKKR